VRSEVGPMTGEIGKAVGISPMLGAPVRRETSDVNEPYIVDWVLPPTQLVDLRTVQRALDEAGRRLTADGHRVRCLYSTFVPTQHRWVCLFSADGVDTVRKTYEIAQLPVPRVEPALDLMSLDRVAG
jgi:hypothetical protein